MFPNDNIKTISELLFIETEIPKVDLTIVLGNDWIPTMDEVYKVYQKGIIQKILLTGHSAKLDKEPEAERFFRKAVALGIAKNDLMLEKKSTNTKENFLFSFHTIEKNIGFKQIKKILIVCKTFHTRRVLMTAFKFFPKGIDYYFLPIIDERNIKKTNWWKNEVAKKRVLKELRRISDYTLKGDLSLE